ncbi:CoA transferase subunit A [Natrinema salsiterrestre]|uniref:CoA transferase subunit A n=1 Tax=Natrinema salsiterrestre TaxID=2950540 RepID=A0A9Q4L9G0_9EURY|nr:CoA-transferase [Natrinema salsiterrestre]MDF9748505.1 CoA transferase subunit A [Natrinema salsiterrestre]
MAASREPLDVAVSRIDAGSTVAAGLALEHSIPFAVGHELLRQGVNDLSVIGPISDLLFDQLIGDGAVSEVRAAWVGNVSAGTGYRFRDAVESGEVTVENHSNFSIALALEAGAMGVPYLPTRSLLGSDIFEQSDQFVETADPFEGEQIALVPAIEPDWAIVHAQRASPHGDVHLWGNTGIVEPAVGAAENVLVTAEEIVDPDVIKSDPSRVAITREQVTSVVECPFGAHPSPVAGHYNRDNEYYLRYNRQTETESGFEDWASKWVYGVADRDEYATLVDADLEITSPTVAAEVQYGQ